MAQYFCNDSDSDSHSKNFYTVLNFPRFLSTKQVGEKRGKNSKPSQGSFYFYFPLVEKYWLTQNRKNKYFRTFESSSRSKRLLLIFCHLLFFDIPFQTVKALSPGLAVFSQSELLMEFHRLLPFGFLEGLTLFSTAYETQMRKKESEDKKMESLSPQESTWSGSSVKVSGPRLV